VGNPRANPPVAPGDPFMIATSAPRHGSNQFAKVQISPATSSKAIANVVNGHEQNIPNLDDLQYACIFPLAEPRVCATGDSACDCAPAKDGGTQSIEEANSPLCQPPSGGVAGTTQYFAKAYPAARELTVLKDLGQNAIVASICPKITSSADPSADPNYGYNPAMMAIADRLKEALGAKCLPRALATVPDKGGSEYPAVDCNVVEVQASDHCDCEQPGRAAPPAALVPPMFSELRSQGLCGSAGNASCDADNFCLCQIKQATGDELTACVAEASPESPGFCYIDDPNSPALAQCPPHQQRKLRFVGDGSAKIPAAGAQLFVACGGHPL
jgi:hypothetical protein